MMYLPSSGAMIEANPSCQIERRVVAGGQLEPLGVEDRDVGVEQRDPQPDALDLGRDPLALLGLDDEVVDVLVVGDAVDRRRSSAIGCGAGEVVVGLDLGHFLERPDAEGPQLADPGRRADAQVVQAERRSRRRS